MGRRIVRNQAMRQDTARLIKAAVGRKPAVKSSPKTVVHSFPRNKPIIQQTPPLPVKIGPNIFLSGGIGDFISIESFMTAAERKIIKNVYLATRAASSIQLVLESAPIFPRMERIINMHNDWSKLFCVYNLEHFKSEAIKQKWRVDLSVLPHDLIDYSIWHVFNQIKEKKRHFSSSSLLSHKLADISSFALPQNYILIQPCSPNDRQDGKRDFDTTEWNSIVKYLHKNNIIGVVILNSDDIVPVDSNVINLSNKTSITEAIEITKQAKEYIGVDSCFAALATKFLPHDKVTIKSVNNHYMENVSIYCAPQQQFNFIHSKVPYEI